MYDVFRELPSSTFCLTSQEVPGFVHELREKFDISVSAGEICARALKRLFAHYGGFKEQPTEEGAVWMPYHNGSHAGYVAAVGVYLAHIDGKSTETKDTIAVAGAYHDWYHHSSEPGKNERQSVYAMENDLENTRLTSIRPRAGAAILGTIVKEIGEHGIVQKAEDIAEEEASYVADADLSAWAGPNAAAWALRLQIEHEVAAGSMACKHADIMRFYSDQAEEKMVGFLSESRSLLLKHRYLSPAGQRLLQPVLALKAAELQVVMKRNHPLDYFDPRKDLDPITH